MQTIKIIIITILITVLFFVFILIPLVFVEVFCEKITWKNIKKVYYILFAKDIKK